MKLYRLDRQRAVAKPHHLVLIAPSAHRQLRGDALRVDDQRVVATARGRAGYAREHARAVVLDPAGLAMDGSRGAHHSRTERLSDGLVSETDPEQRQAAGKVSDRRQRDTRSEEHTSELQSQSNLVC